MRAARVHKPGPPNVIVVEDIDLPEPREQEVLVRVYAAGVGPWDALVRTDKSGLPQTYPLTLGWTYQVSSKSSGRIRTNSLLEMRSLAPPILFSSTVTPNMRLPMRE